MDVPDCKARLREESFTVSRESLWFLWHSLQDLCLEGRSSIWPVEKRDGLAHGSTAAVWGGIRCSLSRLCMLRVLIYAQRRTISDLNIIKIWSPAISPLMCRTWKAWGVLVVTPGINGYTNTYAKRMKCLCAILNDYLSGSLQRYRSDISVCIRSKLGVDFRIAYLVV